MQEDLSLDLIGDEEFPGMLIVRAHLFAMPPPKRPECDKSKLIETKFELRTYLYIGRDLPPSDNTGTSDPFVIVRCAGAMK